MNRDAMRKQMEEVRAQMNQLEAQRAATEALLRAYEGWFRAYPENGSTPQRQLPLKTSGRGGKTKGTVGFRAGLCLALQQAMGEPLREEEIWRRMYELGVRSDSDRPANFVGMTASRTDDVEKVGPRTWRWVDPNARKNGEWHQLDPDAIPAEGGEPDD